MMTTKKCLCAVFLACILFSGGAAGFAQVSSASMDLVVVLDGSQSMYPYFKDVVDYVVSSIIKDYLRFGDNFTLVTFSDSSKIEMSQKIVGESDVKSLLARLYLLAPIGRYTDFLGALVQAKDSAGDFATANRKVMIVITDGVHNPARGTRYYGLDAEAATGEVTDISKEIVGMGWELRIIRIPFTPRGEQGYPAGDAGTQAGTSSAGTELSPGSVDVIGALESVEGVEVSGFDETNAAGSLASSLPLIRLAVPPPEASVNRSFEWKLSYKNESDKPVALEIRSVRIGGVEALERPVALAMASGEQAQATLAIRLPEGFVEGRNDAIIDISYGSDCRVSPQKFEYVFFVNPDVVQAVMGNGYRIAMVALILIALLVFAVLVIFLLKRTGASSRSSMRNASRIPYDRSEGSGDNDLAAAGLRGRRDRAELDERAAAAMKDLAVRDDSGAQLSEAGKKSLSDRRRIDAEAQAAAARIAIKDDSGGQLAEARRKALEDRRALDIEASAAADRLAVKDDAQAQLAEARRKEIEDRRLLDAEVDSASRNLYVGEDASLLAEAARRLRAEKDSSDEQFKANAQSIGGRAEEESTLHSLLGSKVRKAQATGESFKGAKSYVEMLVSEQNSHIGRRNVHELRVGGRKTIGGGGSDYLVFLFPVPARIGEVRYDGANLVFYPLNKKYFPALSGPVMYRIGEEIEMVTPRGVKLYLSFAPFERPETRVNRLLNSLETPGLILDITTNED